jgi:hypothetical protein
MEFEPSPEKHASEDEKVGEVTERDPGSSLLCDAECDDCQKHRSDDDPEQAAE